MTDEKKPETASIWTLTSNGGQTEEGRIEISEEAMRKLVDTFEQNVPPNDALKAAWKKHTPDGPPGGPSYTDMTREQLLEEVERLNMAHTQLVWAYTSLQDVHAHDVHTALMNESVACAWAFDFGRMGVQCYWCKVPLGNDADDIRAHTATCKRPSPEREALKAILDYEPREIVKDEFAFDRMVQNYRDAARAGLGLTK